MVAVLNSYIIQTPSLTAPMKTFSAYEVLDLVNNSDKDDSIHRDATSKSERGNRSNLHSLRQSQNSIFGSEERFEKNISAVNNRLNENESDSSYADECD